MKIIEIRNCASCPYREEGEYGRMSFGSIWCSRFNKDLTNLTKGFPEFCKLKDKKVGE
jgi:hypothetical protein